MQVYFARYFQEFHVIVMFISSSSGNEAKFNGMKNIQNMKWNSEFSVFMLLKIICSVRDAEFLS